MSCGVGHRGSSEPLWLWLWWRQVATAPIPPLAWKPPYAAGGVALKRKGKKKKKEVMSNHGLRAPWGFLRKKAAAHLFLLDNRAPGHPPATRVSLVLRPWSWAEAP